MEKQMKGIKNILSKANANHNAMASASTLDDEARQRITDALNNAAH